MRTDKAAFQAILRESEQDMTDLFKWIADVLGRAILAMADDDGKVPESALPELRRRILVVVSGAFLGVGRLPFDERGRALAPYPRILERGMLAEIDLALLRQAAIWKKLDEKQLAEVKRLWQAKH